MDPPASAKAPEHTYLFFFFFFSFLAYIALECGFVQPCVDSVLKQIYLLPSYQPNLNSELFQYIGHAVTDLRLVHIALHCAHVESRELR